MLLTMRLYKRHDTDLLCLHKQENFSLPLAMKKAILAYLDQDETKVDYPTVWTDISELPSSVQFKLYFSADDENDKRILECINNIPVGYKNSFIKNITRYYLTTPALFSYKQKIIKMSIERDSLFGE